MGKVINFDDIEIQKQKFHQHKQPISIKNIDINKIVLSNKASSGEKGFNILLATKMLKKLYLLCIFLLKMSAYRKEFDENKYMSFLIKGDELLEKYN